MCIILRSVMSLCSRARFCVPIFLCFLPRFPAGETAYAMFGTKALKSLLSGVHVFVPFVLKNDIDTGQKRALSKEKGCPLVFETIKR